jgi:hypothetical protein
MPPRVRSKLAVFGFVALTFFWAWSVGSVASRAKADFPALSAGLMMLTGIGPSIDGFAIVAFFSSPSGLADLSFPATALPTL